MNDGCPGVGTEESGKTSACEGCPNRSACASGEPQHTDIDERLKEVKRKILVLSGKGGVGKSTATAALAYAFTSCGVFGKLGVLDIDITGPSIPLLLGVDCATVHQSGTGWSAVTVDDSISCMSIGFMLERTDAVIWRGPKKSAMIRQFLTEVEWGPLDALLIDTPPGTSDEHLSIVQFLKSSGIDGAVVVTTPQEVALQDVRRELAFCRKAGIRVLGVIENMSCYACPNCAHCEPIFANPEKVAEMCFEFEVPLLGTVPIDPRISLASDVGLSFIEEFPDSPATAVYNSIALKIQDLLAFSPPSAQ